MTRPFFTFRYPITKPYPYTWYPWAVYIGGLCVLVFFSIVNFAANGYILKVSYTTDYNGTIAQKTWAQSLALNGKVAATCQSQNLPLHSQFYTDKLSLIYEIQNIWVDGQEAGAYRTLPSLQYANNPLQECSVRIINIDLEKDSRTAAQIGWKPWGAKALGIVTCLIDNERKTWVNLTARYEFVTEMIESGSASRFVQPPDKNTQSALWWGESLLSWYWLNLVSSMETVSRGLTSEGSTAQALKGSIAMQPSGNTSDIASLNYYSLPTWHFTSTIFKDDDSENQNNRFNGESLCCVNPAGNPKTIGGLHDKGVWPDVWIEADSFTKVFQSVILSDLGQNTSSSNILTNPSLLEMFSGNISKMNDVETPWLRAGPAREPFQQNGNTSLEIPPSVFFTDYLCQVPTVKSAGALIVAVLVADLVFLNAAWMLLNWFAGSRLESIDPKAHYCPGCVSSGRSSVEGKDGTSTVTRGYEPVRRSNDEY